MDIINIFVIVSALFVILLLWFIVGSRHLKSKFTAIRDQWELSDEGLRKRQNLIPNMLETLKKYDKNQEKFIEEVIVDRIHAAKEYNVGAEKIEYEIILSNHINKVFGIAGTNEELRSDTNYLELKKEIIDINKNIDEKVNIFNKMVRNYNKDISKFYLRPIALIRKYKKINIFEFET